MADRALHYPSNAVDYGMDQILSKITSQGQVSVPAAMREALGVKPGSILEWTARQGYVEVRRAATFTTANVHAELFGLNPPALKSATNSTQVKQGIQDFMARKYAGR